MSAQNEHGTERAPELVPWLRGLPLPHDPQRTPAGSEVPAELPHWLEGLTELPAVENPARNSQLPAWLAGLDADDALVSGRANAIQHAPRQAPPSTWRPRQAESPEPADGTAPMPDWLSRLAARRRDAAQGTPDAAGTSGSGPLAAGAERAAGVPATGGSSRDAGIPAWLQSELDQSEAPQAGKVPEDRSFANDGTARAADGLPTLDWLRDIEEAWAADAARVREALSRPERVESGDVSVELPSLDALVPDWMQPSEPRRSPPPPDPARAILQRAGLLPQRAESGPATPAARIVARRSPETQAAVDLMATLAAQDATEAVLTAAPQQTRWQRALLQLPSVVLLAAVLIIALLRPSLPLPAVPPPAVTLDERLAALAPNQTVMVAMEWSPQRAAQLQPRVAEVIELLMQRQVQIVLLSTDPSGAVLGARLLAQSDTEPAGSAILSLGYLPGADLAVRGLHTDFGVLVDAARRRTDAAAPTEPDAAPAAVIVVADQLADVQMWLEQWWTAQPHLPLTFVVPPDVAVQAVSIEGAANVLVLSESGLSTADAPDLRLIHAAFALALVLGLAAALVTRLRGTR